MPREYKMTRARAPKLPVYKPTHKLQCVPELTPKTNTLISRAAVFVNNLPIHEVSKQLKDYRNDYTRSVCEQLGLD